MESRDPIRDFFTFLLGAMLLSMGALIGSGGLMFRSLRSYDAEKERKER
ncbi:MAG: hypothetical protein VKI39_05490 [Synechococcus sp.]|nr:hypothetical protein [Synechococcus sp.]